MTLVFVFLLNRLFYLLFNYQISILFRPYSFWGILFDLLIQNNIEFFTFLGFRALTIPFSFNFVSKWLLVLALIMFFLTVFCTFISYALLYFWYGKLTRYFLVNMYRFPSSYVLMIILYGVRPFLKGAVHALLHQNFLLQLQLLAGVELVMIITSLLFQFFFENYKNMKIFILEILYGICLVILNILLLLKHHYLRS